MTTTFVHVGDFHAGPGPRNADRYRALDQILAETLSLPTLGAYLWPGDLFDGVSTPEDRNAIDARLQRMAARAPVVLVRGNHDRDGDLAGFANLAGAHPIYVIETPQVLRMRTATMAFASVFCVPYPFKAGLVGANVAHGDLVAEAAALFDPLFMVAAEQLAAARAQGDLTLMAFHANIAGAVTSTGQPNWGRELELTPGHLDRLGDIYKAGNHIHRPQQIGGAWYAGSCARNDYGETEEKRYLLAHLEADSSYVVESKPLDVPPMFHVAGLLERHGFVLDDDADEPTRERFMAADWTGCDVRVRWRYLASERAVLDDQAMKAPFAGALRVKFESVVIPDREVRAAGVATARTLHDKLAAMRPDGAMPRSFAEKVTALEQRDRDAVLADVRAWLSAVERGEIAERAA